MMDDRGSDRDLADSYDPYPVRARLERRISQQTAAVLLKSSTKRAADPHGAIPSLETDPSHSPPANHTPGSAPLAASAAPANAAVPSVAEHRVMPRPGTPATRALPMTRWAGYHLARLRFCGHPHLLSTSRQVAHPGLGPANVNLPVCLHARLISPFA